jgi:DNA-binding transcriptional LysR family regulator
MHPSNVPDLSARQLHAVLAVAEYNSFIAAAAFLKTSQPALTRTIKRVEDVLGVRLFDRSTRRVEITAAGKEFVAVAERMLNDLRISVSSMREIGEEQRGQIIVSSIMSIANGVLPAIVAKYRASRPGIEIILREGVHGTVFDDIRSGTADLGITYVDDVSPPFAALPHRCYASFRCPARLKGQYARSIMLRRSTAGLFGRGRGHGPNCAARGYPPEP